MHLPDLNWFRLLVEPCVILLIFLFILWEPEERLKRWRRRRLALKQAKNRTAIGRKKGAVLK